MKAKDVPVGMAFKYADTEDDGLLSQTQFIKLSGKRNVVNVANWTAAIVDDDAEVVVLGKIIIEKDPILMLLEKNDIDPDMKTGNGQRAYDRFEAAIMGAVDLIEGGD